MNNRIDLTQFEGMFEGDRPKHLFEEVEKRFKDGGVRTTPLYLDQQYVNAITLLPDLIAELKRCYEELDKLPTRQELMDIFDYQKWLEYVESCFLADGSFNQDADFVRKCAVNEKYGYRIEVIDGVETVIHESEY